MDTFQERQEKESLKMDDIILFSYSLLSFGEAFGSPCDQRCFGDQSYMFFVSLSASSQRSIAVSLETDIQLVAEATQIQPEQIPTSFCMISWKIQPDSQPVLSLLVLFAYVGW